MNISINKKVSDFYTQQNLGINIEESANLGLIALLIINNKISISRAAEIMDRNIDEVIEIFRENNINWGAI